MPKDTQRVDNKMIKFIINDRGIIMPHIIKLINRWICPICGMTLPDGQYFCPNCD